MAPHIRSLVFLLGTLVALATPAAWAQKVDPAERLRQVDARLRSKSDFKALVHLDEVQRDKRITRQVIVHRRPAEEKFLMLVTEPKTEAGSGYLRMDANFWQYDTKLGRWERRTERDQLAGTNARRRDFDEARYAQEYDAKYEGAEKLGSMKVQKLSLTVKEGVEVPYPKMTIWVDEESGIRKTQEFALSGRLMRTTLIPRYAKVKGGGQEVWYPQEVHIYDEVEKGRRTVLQFRAVDLKRLEDTTFTKAWLESKSR